MKNEVNEAVKRIDKIIQEWEENYIESCEMVELMVPDLKTIICYFEIIQDKVNNVDDKKRKDMEENKRSLGQDLEEELNGEAGRKLLIQKKRSRD